MLYTPISMEEIFPTKTQSYKTVTYEGKMVYIIEDESGNVQIERLISTNPQDYLNHSYSPGTVLKGDAVQHVK